MKPGTPSFTSTRLFDQLRERIRYLHYSLQTEKAYLYWVRFFVRWHGRGGMMEGLRLRIKDVDFDRRVIVVRDAKGGKDRVVMLPQTLAPTLKAQLLHARAVWDADAKASRGGVETPHALA